MTGCYSDAGDHEGHLGLHSHLPEWFVVRVSVDQLVGIASPTKVSAWRQRDTATERIVVIRRALLNALVASSGVGHGENDDD